MIKFEEVFISFKHSTLSAPEVATVTRYQPTYQILRDGSFCMCVLLFQTLPFHLSPHEFSSFSQVQTPTPSSRDGQSFQAFSKVTGCYKMKQQISPALARAGWNFSTEGQVAIWESCLNSPSLGTGLHRWHSIGRLCFAATTKQMKCLLPTLSNFKSKLMKTVRKTLLQSKPQTLECWRGSGYRS